VGGARRLPPRGGSIDVDVVTVAEVFVIHL
jgi:hypothetical protein